MDLGGEVVILNTRSAPQEAGRGMRAALPQQLVFLSYLLQRLKEHSGEGFEEKGPFNKCPKGVNACTSGA